MKNWSNFALWKKETKYPKFIQNYDKESQVEEREGKSVEEKQIKPPTFTDIYWFRPNFCKQSNELQV